MRGELEDPFLKVLGNGKKFLGGGGGGGGDGKVGRDAIERGQGGGTFACKHFCRRNSRFFSDVACTISM